MNTGLTATTVERIQQVLAHYPEVETGVLFGSRAKGTHRPGSDIDLTLCGSGLDHTLLTRIAAELDDLLLPYQIDLSLFVAITHPALLDHIRRVGVPLYERSPAGQVTGCNPWLNPVGFPLA
ncbi:MAG: nucleotidyltransferase domain-containing protein [Verrucomicrobiota bacterium]